MLHKVGLYSVCIIILNVMNMLLHSLQISDKVLHKFILILCRDMRKQSEKTQVDQTFSITFV